jgi:pyruvate,orthophosphate dikinase
MANEGLISREDAITRVEPATLDQMLHPTLDPKAKPAPLATGLPASPGAASGEIVFSADDAAAARQAGHKTILVRVETSPEDIHGMHAAEGIVTTRGGMTSHAAVVARGMGKPCVSGAGAIRIDYAAQTMTAGGVTLKKGDILTIDGGVGQVMQGVVPMVKPEMTGEFATLMGWADEVRRMKVRANAETPTDARVARSFGAEGIGLCRTEHMFFEGERIVAVREMILADTEEGRRAALAKLLPMQRQDFAELFEIMTGLPVTIRLLDPPLHEFLPKTDEEVEEVSKAMGVSAGKLRTRAAELHEFNPMLGFRGVRLAIRFPEIAEMQARAIFEGAVEAGRKTGAPVTAEIMVPLVFGLPELDSVKAIIVAMAETVAKETGALSCRDHDRTAAGGVARGRDRQERRILLLRHQRPHPDDARRLARRRGVLPRHLHGQGTPALRSVRDLGHGGRRRAHAHRRRARPCDQAQPQARHLRRARRRSGLDRLLRNGASRLCLMLTVPHPDRSSRRGAGRAWAQGRLDGVRREPRAWPGWRRNED